MIVMLTVAVIYLIIAFVVLCIILDYNSDLLYLGDYNGEKISLLYSLVWPVIVYKIITYDEKLEEKEYE